MDERIKLILDRKKYEFLLMTLEYKVKFYDILREGKNNEDIENEIIENIIDLYKTIKKYKKEEIVDNKEIITIYLYPSKITVLSKELLDFLYIFESEGITYEKIEEYQLENATPLDEVDYKKLYEKTKKEYKELEKEFKDYKERIANL